LVRRCLVLGLTVSLFAGCSLAQSNAGPATAPQTPPQQPSPKLPSAPNPTSRIAPKPLPQPKRILGMMPNYRAVSAGVLPPPPTSREAFKDATFETFDYSNFIFVGITSLLAEGTDTHPTFGKGIGGYGDYYWHGFLDKAGGNYMVIWALPTVLHEDERYYAKGTGSIWSRAVYAASRVVITPNYHGKNTFNGAEIFGRGISQAVSAAYYPAQDRTAGAIGSKYAYAVGRDALANVFRELWPDISYRVLHMHHRGPAS
jgi:hypothetical protein